MAVVGRDDGNGDANGKWVFVVEVEVGKKSDGVGVQQPARSPHRLN